MSENKVPRYYVLDAAGEPQPISDMDEWARWFGANLDARRVDKTEIGEVEISTVFLGVDHRFGGGPPLLFETMVFGGAWDEWGWRWTTRAQATAGHDQIVAALRDGRSPDEAAEKCAGGVS